MYCKTIIEDGKAWAKIRARKSKKHNIEYEKKRIILENQLKQHNGEEK